MTDFDYDLENREVTVSRTFLTIDGEEFRYGHVVSFLEGISDTDGFMSWVVPNHNEQEFADFLLERDIIGKKANGGLYDKHGECEELYQELEAEYYENFVDD